MLAAALVGLTAAAQAAPRLGPLPGGGGFVIQTCGESGSTHGWVTMNSDPTALLVGLECPPVHRPFDDVWALIQTGVWASDRSISNGGGVYTSPGAYAELGFSVLPGTKITAVHLWRLVRRDFDRNWDPYVVLDDGTELARCDPDDPEADCVVGGDDWYPDDEWLWDQRHAYLHRDGVNASELIVGLRCVPNPNGVCVNSGTLPRNPEATIYSAFLTIAEGSPPVVGVPVGAGWSATGWTEGRLPLAVASQDLVGIYATRVYVDGELFVEKKGECSFDRPRPCEDEQDGADVSLPTEQLADGAHSVELAVVDAAGNEKRLQRPTPLLVDNHPPATPVGAHPVGHWRTPTGVTTIRWDLPPDAGRPIVEARYRICRSGQCTPPQKATSLTSIENLQLPGYGEWFVYVWLVDEAGHEDPSKAALVVVYSDLVHSPTPPSPPGSDEPPGGSPPPASRTTKHPAKLRLVDVRRTTTGLRVRGSITARASGRVAIRVSGRVGKRTRTATGRARIRRRAFNTTIRLPRDLARAPRLTVTARYAGDADTKPATVSRTITRSKARR